MIKSSWLSILRRKLAAPMLRSHKHGASTFNAAPVEVLEQRQLLSAAAIPIGSEYRVNTFTTGSQSSPAVAMDSAGDYVVAWQSSGPETGIFAQRFNAVGSAQGAQFQVTSDYSAPQVAMDSAGDFVIVWAGGDGSGAGILAQRYNAAGVAQGSAFVVNTYTTNDQTTPSVGMDAAGDFVIVWDSTNQFTNGYFPNDNSVYAQRYNSSGAKQGSEFRVESLTTTLDYNPSVAMDAAGDFVVSWTSRFPFPLQNVYTTPLIQAKRYNSSGSVVQDQFGVLGGGQDPFDDSKVAMDPNGDFVITASNAYVPGGAAGIDAALYNSSGGVITGFVVDQNFFLQQSNSAVAFGGNGDFTIAWQITDHSGSGVSLQQYDSSGNPIGPITSTLTQGNQDGAAVAMDAAGDIAFVWHSSGQDNGIYSQQFLTDTAPLLLQIEGTTLSAIGPLYTPLTSTLNVYDGQASDWTGATVQFTSGYQNGQDVLNFTNTSKITGTWNSSTGTLTLSGTDSVSDYRAALRSITYHNTSATPNTSVTRTISIVANDGISSTNTVTRNLTVRPTSTPPSLTGLSATQSYVSPTAPLTIAPNLVVTEPDGLPILSATVSFTNWQGEDRVAFLNTVGLQHTFVQDLTAHTATLTITGSATAAQYQTLLESVTYQDVAGAPNTSAVRNATITVNDQLHSASATTSISVLQYLTGLSATVNYVQGTAPLALEPNLVITQPAGITNINSATVSFTNWQAEDRVSFSNTLALQHTFVQDLTAHTATLTITGTATGAQYQTLLRTVTYQDVAGAPITTTRTATLTVNDGTNSVSATESITVTKVNQPPVVQVNDSSQLTYKVNASSIAIMNMALITDPDSANLSSLTIQISSGYQNGHDVFGYGNVTGITTSFNATTGTLTLSGVSSVSNYRTALRDVTFHTVGSGVSTATRVFTVIATDTTNTSSTPVTRSVTVTT